MTQLQSALAVILVENKTPQFELQESKVLVPKEAYSALKKWNSKFIPYSQKDYGPEELSIFKDKQYGPSYFLADVSGDQKNDLVLYGHDEKKNYVIAVIDDFKLWKVVVVRSWQKPAASEKDLEKSADMPVYILPARGEITSKLKNKTGIQIESSSGNVEVFEVKNAEAISLR